MAKGAAHAKRVAGCSGTGRFRKLSADAGSGNSNNSNSNKYNVKLISLFSQTTAKSQKSRSQPPLPWLTHNFSWGCAVKCDILLLIKWRSFLIKVRQANKTTSCLKKSDDSVSAGKSHQRLHFVKENFSGVFKEIIIF